MLCAARFTCLLTFPKHFSRHVFLNIFHFIFSFYTNEDLWDQLCLSRYSGFRQSNSFLLSLFAVKKLRKS